MNLLLTLFISFFTLFSPSNAKPYDYMVLAQSWGNIIIHLGVLHQGNFTRIVCQSWPPAYCRTVKKCSTPIIINNFTIHGLWDNYVPWIAAPGPCSSTLFDPNEVVGIMSELDINWPNLNDQTDNNWIWSHEFQKNGTCMADILDMKAYFRTAIQWKYAFNFLALLKSSGINPGGSYPQGSVVSQFMDHTPRCTTPNYPQGSVVSAIQKAVKFDVALVCSSKLDQQILLEIRLFINRQGNQVISCSGMGLTSSCGVGQPITFLS